MTEGGVAVFVSYLQVGRTGIKRSHAVIQSIGSALSLLSLSC